MKHDIKRLPQALVSELREVHLKAIQNDPAVGLPLKGALKGILPYHFHHIRNQYRIAYVHNVAENQLTVLMIRKRENFYDTLQQRLS